MTGNSPLRNVTPAEVAAFARDGYVVLREVLSPAWLLPLVEACNRLVNLPETLNITAEAVALALPTTADGLFGAPRYRKSMPQRGRFFVHFNSARQDEAVLQFALQGAVGALAAGLMRSRTARFVDDILFVKEPYAQEVTEWHDDDGGGVMVGAQKCSLWISLGDVDRDSAPLMFLRGSHVAHRGWRVRGERADDIVSAESVNVVTCPIRCGDVIAHHPATIHCGGSNMSSVPRRSWALRFAGDGVRFALPALRDNERDWYGLCDGDLLDGPRFPIAWPVD